MTYSALDFLQLDLNKKLATTNNTYNNDWMTMKEMKRCVLYDLRNKTIAESREIKEKSDSGTIEVALTQCR